MAHLKIDYSEIVLTKRIGRGRYSEVWKGMCRERECAVKKLFHVDNVQMQKYIVQEMEILANLNHPNIVALCGLCIAKEGVFIVMEYVDGTTLSRMLRNETINLSWKRRLGIALRIALAMRHLHRRGYMHRDLSSENVLIGTDWSVKLCDFGLSRRVPEQHDEFLAMTQVGTHEWMAPEVACGKPYSQPADVFSFGMVLYELMTREFPPERQIRDLYNVDLSFCRSEVFKSNAKPPRGFWELFEACVDKDSSKRPNFQEIVERIRAIVRRRKDTSARQKQQQYLLKQRGEILNSVDNITSGEREVYIMRKSTRQQLETVTDVIKHLKGKLDDEQKKEITENNSIEEYIANHPSHSPRNNGGKYSIERVKKRKKSLSTVSRRTYEQQDDNRELLLSSAHTKFHSLESVPTALFSKRSSEKNDAVAGKDETIENNDDKNKEKEEENEEEEQEETAEEEEGYDSVPEEETGEGETLGNASGNATASAIEKSPSFDENANNNSNELSTVTGMIVDYETTRIDEDQRKTPRKPEKTAKNTKETKKQPKKKQSANQQSANGPNANNDKQQENEKESGEDDEEDNNEDEEENDDDDDDEEEEEEVSRSFCSTGLEISEVTKKLKRKFRKSHFCWLHCSVPKKFRGWSPRSEVPITIKINNQSGRSVALEQIQLLTHSARQKAKVVQAIAIKYDADTSSSSDDEDEDRSEFEREQRRKSRAVESTHNGNGAFPVEAWTWNFKYVAIFPLPSAHVIKPTSTRFFHELSLDFVLKGRSKLQCDTTVNLRLPIVIANE